MTTTYKQVDWMFNTDKFADDCLAKRQQLALTQNEVSIYLGFESPQGYGRIERGNVPKMRAFFDLCNLFELTPTDYVQATQD